MVETEKASRRIAIAVVGGLIVAAFIYIARHWLPPIVGWAINTLTKAWVWMISSHAVLGWVLLGLCTLALPSIIRIIRSAFRTRRPTEAHGRDFTELEYDGVLWRWQYSHGGDIHSLVSFCARPGCDMQIFAGLGPYRSPYYQSTKYECDRCGHAIDIEGSEGEIESKVMREIQRLLRSGGWKQYARRNP